jgi:SAM-dependent methyltransferase
MNYLQQLLDSSRLLLVLYENLPENIRNSKLYAALADYFERYTAFNNINADAAIDIYTDYITTFNKHCKQFINTGKYPVENGITNLSLTREQYDVILILSVLLTPHRFRIMEILEQQKPSDKALFIGLGPGLEMLLTTDKYKEMHAYDLQLNNFLYKEFPNVSIKAELYTGQYPDYFDAIYLIEILEHLSDPYELLAICGRSLKKGGRILLTTATDIPQFDHLYNFPLAHDAFNARITEMGFRILSSEAIPHHYMTLKLNPYNHFYIIEKI